MAHVFAYHKLKNQEDWFLSDEYKRRQIDAISDPEGGSTDHPPTSVPSPFAQLDLTKGSFKRASDSNNFENLTRIDFKLISDCLDVGEVFFNLGRLDNKYQIKVWNKQQELDRLIKSSNAKHKRLGEVLQLYMENDATTYNFHHLSKLYLLQCDYKMVGGISPATLFFASSNDLDFAQERMASGDILFDRKYCHLYNRDESYQLFLYSFRKYFDEVNYADHQKRFAYLFEAFSNYLDDCLRILEESNPILFKKINELDASYYESEFEESTTGVASDYISILGVQLRRKKSGSQLREQNNSDFRLNSSKQKDGLIPLILQRGHGGVSKRGRKMIYCNAELTKAFSDAIPYDNTDILFEEMHLPGLQTEKYPYYTNSHFLEPYLIKLVYAIDTDHFFNGNFAHSLGEVDFLLPIKPLFFEHFSVEELKSILPDGKPFFEMEEKAGGAVKVILRIPIGEEGEYIAFDRTYYSSLNEYDFPEPDTKNNRGAIIENQFSIAIFPFYQLVESDGKTHYRIMLIDRDKHPTMLNNDYQLKFFRDTAPLNEVTPSAVRKRSDKQLHKKADATTKYVVLNEEFDFIQLRHHYASGLIIPKFKKITSGNATFKFAVDFGTTYTHIEYKVDNGTTKPFEVGDLDRQLITLHDKLKSESIMNNKGALPLLELVRLEFLPERIGRSFKDGAFFPQRTVLSEIKGLNFNLPNYTLADFNIAFPYGKDPLHPHNEAITDLKWADISGGDHSENVRRIEAFFEELLFLMRNKVLLNNGNIAKTKLTWFYPSSMMIGRVNQLQRKWNEKFKAYITDEGEPTKMSESIAPYYYYNKIANVKSYERPVVTIDIGGGTTDILIYLKNKPILSTSFTFAANNIYGDGIHNYPGYADRNGFIYRYGVKINDLLNDNGFMNLATVYENMLENDTSQNIISFFFSLESNERIINKNVPKNRLLSALIENDSYMKFVFLTFYMAIFYHIAKLMKLNDLAIPKYITFSGNGSRSLKFISTDKTTLGLLVKELFKQVYEDNSFDKEVTIVTEDSFPKEVTCKGALEARNVVEIHELNKIKKVLIGTPADTLVSQESYDTLDDNIVYEVSKEVNSFVEQLFDLHKQFNYSDFLDISVNSFDEYRNILQSNIIDNLSEGIDLKKEQANQGEKLEETLFFYHFKVVLRDLAYYIAQNR